MRSALSEERRSYSPSLACTQRFRPFWIDARKGCRYSAADRQTMRDRSKLRSDRGVLIDRYPPWKSHGERFSETSIARPHLAARLLSEHHARAVAPVDASTLREKRAAYFLAELEETARCGLSGDRLRRHLASDPGLRDMLRELERLAGAR